MTPNNSSTLTTAVFENDKLDDRFTNILKRKMSQTKDTNKLRFVWINIVGTIYFHIGALYAAYLMLTSAKIATAIFSFILVNVTGMGISAGVHRLWSHRSYKAKLPLRLLLTFLNTVAFQMPIIKWAHDHRLHHKYSETNADPQNTNRGVFFSHWGWVLCRKHPDVLEKGKGIDMSDLYADPILRFQKKHYPLLMFTCCFLLPTMVPVYFWSESWTNSYYVATILRWTIVSHLTALVNSVAHRYGNKPYDENICPSDNLGMCITTFGEGWHNYHHVFPWDYRSSELGNYSFNTTTAFINFFAWIGWAYDLKTVSPDMIKKRVQRTGDGTHAVWGWDDKSVTREDEEATNITHKKCNK